MCRSQYPRGLNLGMRPLFAGISRSNPADCVLSRRDMCVGLITCPEGSYRLWCVHLSVMVNPR